jgi:hypothetical protein
MGIAPRARTRTPDREDWATGFFFRVVGRQGIRPLEHTTHTLEHKEADRKTDHTLIPSSMSSRSTSTIFGLRLCRVRSDAG